MMDCGSSAPPTSLIHDVVRLFAQLHQTNAKGGYSKYWSTEEILFNLTAAAFF